ncbi:MAG: hypothetical protein K6G50_11885 [bacterium]|nr:hypothetical protein [bacterium]
MNKLFTNAAIMAMAAGCLVAVSGCAPSQATHYSAQIGRFYENGVAFSVPLAERSDKPGTEDKFWEVRQGISNAFVTVLSPADPESDKFRENIIVVRKVIDPGTNAENLRASEAASLAKEKFATGDPELGEDKAGPWIKFSSRQDNTDIVCKAWFFVQPAEKSPEDKPFGIVFLGAAQAGESLDAYLKDFDYAASTLEFARPKSGFEHLGDSCADICAAFCGGSSSEASPQVSSEPSQAAEEPAKVTDETSQASDGASESGSDVPQNEVSAADQSDSKSGV